MNLLEIDRRIIELKMERGDSMEQEWLEGIKGLFRLVGEKAQELNLDSGLLCKILRTLIEETGSALERRLPHLELLEKWLEGKISVEEFGRQEGESIHGSCRIPYYPRVCSPHPIIRPSIAIKNLILDYILTMEIDSPK